MVRLGSSAKFPFILRRIIFRRKGRLVRARERFFSCRQAGRSAGPRHELLGPRHHDGGWSGLVKSLFIQSPLPRNDWRAGAAPWRTTAHANRFGGEGRARGERTEVISLAFLRPNTVEIDISRSLLLSYGPLFSRTMAQTARRLRWSDKHVVRWCRMIRDGYWIDLPGATGRASAREPPPATDLFAR